MDQKLLLAFLHSYKTTERAYRRRRTFETFLCFDRLDYVCTYVRACSMDQLLLCCMVVCAALHTPGLAVVSCVPTGTVTVSIGRWTMAGSSILTGGTAVCNMKQIYICVQSNYLTQFLEFAAISVAKKLHDKRSRKITVVYTETRNSLHNLLCIRAALILAGRTTVYKSGHVLDR